MNYFLYYCRITELFKKMAKKNKKIKKVNKRAKLKKVLKKKYAKKAAPKKVKSKAKPKRKSKNSNTKPKAKIIKIARHTSKLSIKKIERKPKKKTVAEKKKELVNLPIVTQSIPEKTVTTKTLIQPSPTQGKPPLILVKPKSTKTVRKIMTALTEVPEPKVFEIAKSGKPEPKGKYRFEFVFQCSVPLMYEFLSQPSGLSEWFSDDVNIKDNILTFFWDGQQQMARIIGRKEGKFIRFQWLDKPDNYFFEFAIEVDDLTGELSLIITDFAEDGEIETAKLLWEVQVEKLHKAIGS